MDIYIAAGPEKFPFRHAFCARSDLLFHIDVERIGPCFVIRLRQRADRHLCAGDRNGHLFAGTASIRYFRFRAFEFDPVAVQSAVIRFEPGCHIITVHFISFFKRSKSLPVLRTILDKTEQKKGKRHEQGGQRHHDVAGKIVRIDHPLYEQRYACGRKDHERRGQSHEQRRSDRSRQMHERFKSLKNGNHWNRKRDDLVFLLFWLPEYRIGHAQRFIAEQIRP